MYCTQYFIFCSALLVLFLRFLRLYNLLSSTPSLLSSCNQNILLNTSAYYLLPLYFKCIQQLQLSYVSVAYFQYISVFSIPLLLLLLSVFSILLLTNYLISYYLLFYFSALVLTQHVSSYQYYYYLVSYCLQYRSTTLL